MAVLIVVLALQGLALALAGPAAAHGALKSTSPAEGEELSVAPTQVILDFNEVPLPLGTAVAVTDAQGSVVSIGQVQLDQRRLTQPVAPDLPPGDYRIAWRATSADGHPVSGELGFAVAAGAGAAASPGTAEAGDDAGPTAGVPGDPTSDSGSAADASASPPLQTPQVSADAGVNGGGGLSGGALLTGSAAALLLVAVAVSVLRRRGRTTQAESGTDQGLPR